MTQPSSQPQGTAEQREPCPNGKPDHHWVIETAEGATSVGECQNCHEVREYKNSFTGPESPWKVAQMHRDAEAVSRYSYGSDEDARTRFEEPE